MIGNASRLNVLVFNGSGVSPQALEHCMWSLKKTLGAGYDIQQVGSDHLQRTPWEVGCAMLVMPGGRDRAYLEALGPTAVDKIRRYVTDDGGSYFGICAGAYFAARRIEFEKGRVEYEIVEPRPLGLFPGRARGTVFPGFVYGTEAGAHAVELCIDSSFSCSAHVARKIISYYNGGCAFDFDGDSADAGDWTVLASYAAKDNLPAIVFGRVGKGKVLLSGAHPEYATELLKAVGETPTHVVDAVALHENEKDGLFREIISLCITVPDTLHPAEAPSPITCLVGAVDGFSSASHHPLFDALEYRTALRTAQFGQNLLFAQSIPSTQTYFQEDPLMTAMLPQGTAFVAAEQTAGKGRGTNKWISPPPGACLQFTFAFQHPAAIADHLSMVQCLVAMALVRAIQQLTSSAALVFIKWPNDIYARSLDGSLHKIGGILVNTQSSVGGDSFMVLVGCGLNVKSTGHFKALEDVYGEKTLSTEPLLAKFFNFFESLYSSLLARKVDKLTTEYASLWMHSGQVVHIEADNTDARIKGIDSFGYLIAEETGTGRIIRLQPDGNSFDMMANLIKLKV